MTLLKTQLNPRSVDFQSNVAAMNAVVADLHEKVEKIALGGPEAARQKHLARGKLLPRERVNGLLDPGTPFLEIGQFAAYERLRHVWRRCPGGFGNRRHRPG
jgi:3-methylcrotonyl-CoA carboxylase beta subunit